MTKNQYPSNNILLFLCLAVAGMIWLGLTSDQALGNDIDLGQKPIITSPQKKAETITSGIHGPFSQYYFPSLALGPEVCYLVTSNFTVICFPAKTLFGKLLAETETKEKIQAQLFAVNNGQNDRPMPEFVLNIPLADMDQKFFSTESLMRLLGASSIFDEACKLTYQVDGQAPKSEEWLCSSFLKHFDKYTGQPKLSYELRIRPIALRAASNKTTSIDKTQDMFNFFKNLKNGKVLNIKVDLLNDELIFNSTFNLTAYDRWINRLLEVFFIDKPTIDMSPLDEMAHQVAARYPTDNNEITQDSTDKGQAVEKVYGPFEYGLCKVRRYVEHWDRRSYSQFIYPDMFLVDCISKRRMFEEKTPAWAIQITVPKNKENKSDLLKKEVMDVDFSQRTSEPSSSISINDMAYDLMAITSLTYNLGKMPPDLFNSQVVQKALHRPSRQEAPCTVSYLADGQVLSQEKLKCDLSISEGIDFIISIDYGFQNCYLLEDKPCQKEALLKAASFLKEIKEVPQKLEMKIEFEGGEAVTADLNLSTFDPATVGRLLKRIDALD